MNQENELPNVIEMEKQVLAAMMMKCGRVIPKIMGIISAEDFYRPEHKIIFQKLLDIYAQGDPPNLLSLINALLQFIKEKKIDIQYLYYLSDYVATDAYAEVHARTIKEKSALRRLMLVGEELTQKAQLGMMSPVDLIAEHQLMVDEIRRSATSSKKISFAQFFAEKFKANVVVAKAYADRSTGFENLDAHQFFLPGLYVIGATPAAGKTTFCYQLLEQLANNGESCIYCSYEMSQMELFSKSLARELFKRDEQTDLTAAQIRKGATSVNLESLVEEFSSSPLDLNVLELQDETVDELLKLLRPLCSDNTKAPVVCLDYLQIIPTSRESNRLGIDDTVRKLKKFQRDTNTTFIVISSFNRTNYTQPVSFESFKESGNIEYTADVVWALQLNAINKFKGYEISLLRQKIDEAKKQQPRQVHLKCLKNRQGTNYDCFFEYFSAHDYFEPCDNFNEIEPPPQQQAKIVVKK